ncbi:MAG TPA: PilZ domain-containing protein [Candidatus Ozemobacteraceae bacterium]
MDFRQLLNWITGRAAGEQAPEQAPAQSERRRFQRIGLSDGLVWLNAAGPFSVLNLSYGGIKFEIPGEAADRPLPGVGETIEARIQLGNVRFSTRLTICNRFGTVFGCSFSGLTPAAARLMSDFLKPRILGASITEIDSSRLQHKDGDLRMRWFQGEEGTQIFLWQSLEGEIVKQEYYFLDYIITWNQRTQTFQTGRLRDEHGKSGFGRIDPSTVVFFKIPSHRALQMGRKILECAALPAEARDQMLANLAREERRLYQRYVVRAEERAPRLLLDGEGSRTLVVTNLSAGGIAFLTPETGAASIGSRGDLLSGRLELGGAPLSVKVRIMYATPQTVGGSLEPASPEDADAFARFLAPRLLGQSLEELPTPLEELPTAFRTARAYLHIGLHNTHVISIVAPDGTLTAGRISFMDHILVWERSSLAAWKCPGGIVFPRDWELPLDILEREPQPPEHLPPTCREMIAAAALPPEVAAAWERVLS